MDVVDLKGFDLKRAVNLDTGYSEDVWYCRSCGAKLPYGFAFKRGSFDD